MLRPITMASRPLSIARRSLAAVNEVQGPLSRAHPAMSHSGYTSNHSLARSEQTFPYVQVRLYSSTPATRQASSPFAAGGQAKITKTKGDGEAATKTKRKKKIFLPRKAAVQMTEKARTFFKKLLDMNPEKAGVMLNYGQSSSGEPRMVYSFDFVSKEQLDPQDEGISLELLADGSPKPPEESRNDDLPKLYVHHDSFMKVLGATVDVDLENVTPIMHDREGNLMDPNA